MMRLAFLCGSRFQLLNCLNYILYQKDYSDRNIDIYISGYLDDVDILIDNINKERIVDNIYKYYSFEVEGIKGKIYKLVSIMYPSIILNKLMRNKIKIEPYDCIFTSCTSRISIIMRLNNPYAKVFYFDDGLATYIDGIEKYKFSDMKILFSTLKKIMPTDRVDALYVNNKNICNSSLTDNIIQLHSLRELNTETNIVLHNVFAYKKNVQYAEKRIIYLTQPNEESQKYDEAESIQNGLESVLKKYADSCLVRRHPRQKEKEYKDFIVVSDNSLWELICAQDISDDHILIGIFSTAQVVPKMLYDKEPWIVFTYGMFRDIWEEEFYYKVENMVCEIKKIYSNPEKVIIVDDNEKLIYELDRIMR